MNPTAMFNPFAEIDRERELEERLEKARDFKHHDEGEGAVLAGEIVAVRRAESEFGPFDVIYVDRHRKDGGPSGVVFSVAMLGSVRLNWCKANATDLVPGNVLGLVYRGQRTSHAGREYSDFSLYLWAPDGRRLDLGGGREGPGAPAFGNAPPPAVDALAPAPTPPPTEPDDDLPF